MTRDPKYDLDHDLQGLKECLGHVTRQCDLLVTILSHTKDNQALRREFELLVRQMDSVARWYDSAKEMLEKVIEDR